LRRPMTSFSATATTNSRAAAPAAAPPFDTRLIADLYRGGEHLASRPAGRPQSCARLIYCAARVSSVLWAGSGDMDITVPWESVAQSICASGDPVLLFAKRWNVYPRL
jgi:hypothetical protein